MLPARRFNGQYGLTDFFNDFFENRSLEKVEFTTPAINVKENDTEYLIINRDDILAVRVD